MVQSMRSGSVIVDLAAESGGNCELTRAGETVQAGPVSIIGPVNLPASVPYHASQMFGKNVLALVTHLASLAADARRTDEILGPMTVVADGAVVVAQP
jgi:NAD(P) transhydrogenase subunit alpha